MKLGSRGGGNANGGSTGSLFREFVRSKFMLMPFGPIEMLSAAAAGYARLLL